MVGSSDEVAVTTLRCQCGTWSSQAGRIGVWSAAMVTVLKHRIALAVLVGVLVIPVLTSNLGGIGQLLACTAVIEQPFALAGQSEESPQVTSSRQVTREDETIVEFEGADGDAVALCEGVTASLSAVPIDDQRVRLDITIVNDSDAPWRGTMGVDAVSSEIDANVTRPIGDVPPGGSGTGSLELRVPEGQTDIAGTVLLGP